MADTPVKRILNKSNGRQRRAAAIVVGLLLALSTFALWVKPAAVATPSISSAKPADRIRVAIDTRVPHHYDTHGTPHYFNLSLLWEFTRDQKLTIDWVETDSAETSQKLLRNDLADLVVTEHIEPKLHPRPGIRSVAVQEASLLLIGVQGPSIAPLSPAELQNKTIAVIKNSGVSNVMKSYQKRWPGIQLMEIADRSTGELLDMVMSTQVQYAVVQSNEFLTLQHFFPDLIAKLELSGSYSLGWLMNTKDSVLVSSVEQFIRAIKASGKFADLAESNHGHLWNFNYTEATTFLSRVNSLLPLYEPLFKQVARHQDVDWRLLAAMAYQESHWDPEAVSPTGVRGMMMLTQDAAAEIGVTNRLDSTQSIQGGAAYLRRIMDLLPEDITDPDKTWMAIAAYNVGRGHLLDARKITETLGGNPNSWQQVRQRLPLLSDPVWYQTTTYGVARGREPVLYVDNVRRYYDMLLWITRQREAAGVS